MPQPHQTCLAKQTNCLQRNTFNPINFICKNRAKGVDNVISTYYIYTMNATEQPQLPPLKVDRTKLITQSEYARKKGLSRQRIGAMIKAKQLNVVEILGTVLILMD